MKRFKFWIAKSQRSLMQITRMTKRLIGSIILVLSETQLENMIYLHEYLLHLN